ncbi:MAG: IMP dehydrogenase, partial [Gammaproteobacteria bacterium]
MIKMNREGTANRERTGENIRNFALKPTDQALNEGSQEGNSQSACDHLGRIAVVQDPADARATDTISLHPEPRAVTLPNPQKNRLNDIHNIKMALTFDDVLLKPAYSEVLPKEVSLKTRLTRTITLNLPLMSAAMDTVTEAALARGMAQLGGLGILHKSMP